MIAAEVACLLACSLRLPIKKKKRLKADTSRRIFKVQTLKCATEAVVARAVAQWQ